MSSESSLAHDWLANTRDPFPAFSLLVYVSRSMFGDDFFYVFYILLLTLYFFLTIRIVSEVFSFDEYPKKVLYFTTALFLFYSGIIHIVVGFFEPFKGLLSFANPEGYFTQGVAGQYLLGGYLQPSTFGVFLILSIYFFIKRRRILSVIAFVVAIYFHSTYLLPGAFLTVTYMVLEYKQSKKWKVVLHIGISAFILVLPVLIYNLVNFQSNSFDIAQSARDILINFRIPHHAKFSEWFIPEVIIQLFLIFTALYILRNSELFRVLAWVTLGSISLSFIAIFFSIDFLLLLFPWRWSAVVVPLSFSVIIGFLVNRFSRDSYAKEYYAQNLSDRTSLVIMSSLIGFAMLFFGIRNIVSLLNSPKTIEYQDSIEISNLWQDGDLYMIPPNLKDFRLATGMPILVDFKSHPYASIEVVEWYRRLELTTEFYNSENNQCETLQRIENQYSITHVLFADLDRSFECPCGMDLIYQSNFRICQNR